MAITHVASLANAPGLHGGTSPAMDTTGADLILISLSWYPNFTPSPVPTDSKSNTWTGLTARTQGNSKHQFFYCLNPTVGTGHTFTVSGSLFAPAWVIQAFAGVGSFDQQIGTTGSGTPASIQPGSLTPSANNALVVTGIGGEMPSGLSVTGGLTQTTIHWVSGSNLAAATGWAVQTTATAINPTWTWTGASNGVAVATVSFLAAIIPDWNPTYIQTDTGSLGGSAPTYTKTFAGNVTDDNILVALCAVTVGISSVTDSQGNIWTKHREQTPTAAIGVSLWTAFAGSTGACTVTMTVTSGSGAFSVYEFTADGAVALVLDVGSGANISGTSHAAGSVTPTVNDTWALYGIGVIGGFTITSGPTDYFRRGATTSPVLYERKLITPVTHNPAVVTGTSETTAAQVVVLKQTALVPPVPPEVEFLDGGVSYPLCWLEYTDRVGDQHIFAEVDLNDRQAYYGGYKRPWVVDFLAITRGLSDPTGQLEHLAFGARLSDTTRFFRGQLADPERRYVGNRPLVERMIADEDRRAELTPRIIAVGYAKSPQVLPSLQVQLPGTDWIAKKFIRKQRQEEDWIARVTAADFPTAPIEVLDQTIPILYGELSDETASGPTLSKPTSLHARVFGTVADPVTKRFYVTGMTGQFGFQAPSDHRGETDAAWIDVPGCPSDAELAAQQASGTVHAYVEINWDCTGAFRCRVYKSQSGAAPKFVDEADFGPGYPPAVTPGDPSRSWGYIPDSNTDAHFFFLDGERPYGAAELNTYKLDGDPPLTNATGTADTGSGIVPTFYVGYVTIGGLVYHQFLVTACAIKAITSVYVGGIRLTNTQRDASFRVPGTAIWTSQIDALHTYVDRNDHRFTIIYGLAGDLVADACAKGEKPLTVNALGIETTGDATGTLIRSLALQEQHFARNYLAAEPSYRGGNWLTATPQFPEPTGLTLMDDASFEAMAAAFPVEGAGMLAVNNQSITGTNALGSFHVSGDWEAFFNRRGQLALTREPDSAPATATTLTDVVHVIENSFRITDQYDRDFANILPYTHTRDYAGLHKTKNGWISGDLTITDATSTTGYEQERRSNPWALEWLREPLAAAEISEVMTRKLARTTNPLRQAQLKLSYEGLTLEVGDVFRFTHAEGIGAEGWVDRWVRVMRHEVQPSAGIVTLEVYDLELVWAARDELDATSVRGWR